MTISCLEHIHCRARIPAIIETRFQAQGSWTFSLQLMVSCGDRAMFAVWNLVWLRSIVLFLGERVVGIVQAMLP